MQFNPAIHTKEFLLDNPEVAFELARYSVEFSTCALASDLELIGLVDTWGFTVAHRLAQYQPKWIDSAVSKSPEILRMASKNSGQTVAHMFAQYQPEWLKSEASKSPEILRLANIVGYTVAHWLAQYQPEWLKSDASKLPEILMLTSNGGWTVAHYLAHYQPEWLQSAASTSPEILQLTTDNGTTVARWLVDHQGESINHQPLMQKQILTLDFSGKLLAERFTEIYGDIHGLDTSTMAMKLIEQGAAYKHSKTIALKVGDTLLKQCKILIEDNLDAQIGLKQLMALYSTFSHNVSKIISTDQQKSLQKWQDILHKSENMIRQHLNTHPELYDIEHTVDIFCEPADDLLNKLQSERILSVELGGLQSSISSNDIEPIKQAIY
jgi:hypothetical protein